MLMINVTMSAEKGVVTVVDANGAQWLTVNGRDYVSPDGLTITARELNKRVCGGEPSAVLSAQLDPLFAAAHIRRIPDGKAYTYTLTELNGMVSVRRKDLTPRKPRRK